MNIHKQVYSEVVGAEVDEKMVPLLEWLTINGVNTLFSCQGVEEGEQPEESPYGTAAYVALDADSFGFLKELKGITPEMTFVHFPSSAYVYRTAKDEINVEERDANNVLVFRIPRQHLEFVTDRWTQYGILNSGS